MVLTIPTAGYAQKRHHRPQTNEVKRDTTTEMRSLVQSSSPLSLRIPAFKIPARSTSGISNEKPASPFSGSGDTVAATSHRPVGLLRGTRHYDAVPEAVLNGRPGPRFLCFLHPKGRPGPRFSRTASPPVAADSATVAAAFIIAVLERVSTDGCAVPVCSCFFSPTGGRPGRRFATTAPSAKFSNLVAAPFPRPDEDEDEA